MGGKQAQEGGVDEEAVVAPLFERKEARFRSLNRVFAFTIMVGICSIWFYRLTNYMPSAVATSSTGGGRKWVWIGMLMAELCFGVYWILTQSVRWGVSYSHPYKNRLSQRLV